MAWRFQKRIKIAPGVRLNVSKGGLGLSAGVRGARVGMNTSRGLYRSIGIPGTGLYDVKYAGSQTGKSSSPEDAVTLASEVASLQQPFNSAIGCFALLILMALVMFVFTPLWASVWIVSVAAAFYLFKASKAYKYRYSLHSLGATIKAGKTDESIQKARDVIGLTDDLEVQRQMALIMYGFGDRKDCIPVLEQAYQIDEGSDLVCYALADCNYANQRYEEATKYAQAVPTESPARPAALLIAAKSFANQGQFELAAQVLQETPLRKQKLDETLIEIHYVLAKIYERLGDKRKAGQHAKRVCAADARYKDASAILARTGT